MIPQVCFYLLLLIINKCHGYQNSWNSDRRLQKIPQDVMVDVVNNLALKLLAIHNEGNDNNIAISPYGAVSVLVALKEGLRGNAAYEIQQAANIPSDLSVIRIGLRDIHRHLRSYFIPEEGFLSGLTLSHDNVTLNREYEDILKFYGFDINSFNNAVFGDLFTTTVATTEEVTTSATNMPTVTTESISTTTQIVSITENMVPKEEMTTQNDRITRSEATTTEMTITTTVTPTTTAVTATQFIPTSTVTTTTAPTTQVFTSNVVTTTQQVTTTVEPTTEYKMNEETEKVTTVKPTTTVTEFKLSDETEKVTTVRPTSTETTTVTEFKLSDETEKASTVKLTSTETTTVTEEVTTETTEEDFDTITTTDEETENSSTDSSTNEIQDETTEYLDENETNDTLHRTTRSVVDYIIARYYDDHTITQRPPPYNSENDLYFLINGMYKEGNINYMTYDTVLPFHYIPHLKTLALRFPLDSARYYLLLLLPENPQNINKLICDLRLNGNLKYIINNLSYTHVKAIIPSFMLKGFVVLTPTLQKMGIRQVFEPRQADFSQMTPDRNIYVTNIEQAITVNIRNYMDPIMMNNNNRYLQRNNPVLFRADHPFLYFVMDSEIDVTLMMGKIVNPLNSRIR